MPTPNELFQEASCFNCASNASMSDLLKLALLQRIAEGGGGGGGTPGGANGSVQFNNGGAFGGFGNYNSGTSVLTLPGDLIFSADNADDIGASGATRPRTGYFGTSVVTPLATILAAANANAIAVTGYSLTGANAQSMLSLAGTWNTSGTPTAIDLNITDTASNAASLLADFRVGGTSLASITKAGAVVATTSFAFKNGSRIDTAAASTIDLFLSGSVKTRFSAGAVNASDSFAIGASAVSPDVFLTRDAANTFAQRSGTNAQVHRIYRTFTNSTNYERLALQTVAGAVQLAAETAGTGTDDLDIQLTTAGTGLVNYTNQSASVDAGVASTHSFRIKVGGTEYKVLLATP